MVTRTTPRSRYRVGSSCAVQQHSRWKSVPVLLATATVVPVSPDFVSQDPYMTVTVWGCMPPSFFRCIARLSREAQRLLSTI
jgi:hypothetical protein